MKIVERYSAIEPIDIEKGIDIMGYFLRGIVIALFLLFVLSSIGSTSEIDYQTLAYCESSNRATAVSCKKAIGLYQITQPCLDDFNKSTGEKYTLSDMRDPLLNEIVSKYYLEILIPQYLKNIKKPVTINNRLRSYHDGIGNVRKGYTSNKCRYYIAKYWLVYYLNLWRSL